MAEEQQEINVDQLLEESSKAAPERAMTGGDAPQEAPAAAPTWDGKAWEFEWNGKKVSPDSQDKAKTWMSQGYNYSQRMGELNKTWAQRQAEYQQAMAKVQEQEKLFNPYRQVDEYARANPQWWAQVQQAFQQRQQGQQVDPQLQSVLKPFEEKLGQVEQVLGQWQQAQQVAEEKKHDEALDSDIEAIRKQYPNIDLNAQDPQTGEPLEIRILKHAQAIGTGSFKTAFRDYLHDQLIEHAKASGREAIAKDAQVAAKKGILGKTPAPMKAVQPTSVRGKSYNDLANEALRELGLTS